MKTNNKIGQLPGSLIHVGKVKNKPVKTTLIDYNANDFTELECKQVNECLSFENPENTYWLNVDGLNQPDIISIIGKKLNLHPLLLEDILNTTHRPKVEEFEGYLFFTLKMITINVKKKQIESEQVSLVLGPNWLVTFQEQEGDIFDAIRIRLKENKGLIRKSKADYLLYSIIDIIVDHYFIIIDFLNDEIEDLEDEVLYDPTQESSIKIQNLKRLLMNFRKSMLPLREAVSSLQKYNNNLINEETLRYYRDIYEHLIHLTDNLESQRDMLASIMDLYLSGISNKMNQVMKVLTIIATIFIPLTFIVGVYGMNFKNIPELNWRYGYFAIWGIMLVIVILMLVYFKRKKWLE
jgi:magnesium transporter